MENEGFTEEIKEGFLFCLLSSERPINEVLYPNSKDQKSAFTNQFEGMTDEPFTYEEYEQTRENLVQTIHANLTDEDKGFLLAFKELNPDWSKVNYSEFPSIKWKLQNLAILKDKNPEKYTGLYTALQRKLGK